MNDEPKKAQPEKSPEKSIKPFAGWTEEDKAEFRKQMSESLERNLRREAEREK